jgi:hypothetical protein
MSISLKDFMECVNYKITEGSEYLWSCYGPNAYQIDSWNGRHDEEGYTVNIVFDTKDQSVYEMQAWDYGAGREYRWINPDYIDAVKAEYVTRGVDFSISVDDSRYIDLEVENDILEKARAIVIGEEYDARIQVPLTLSDSDLLLLMKMAHEKDMTLNQFVESVLLAKMAELKGKDRNVWP